MTPSLPDQISLRPAEADDQAFLFELYRDTRAEEMAAWGWGEAQQHAFLSLQFRARTMSYSAYPNTEHSIVLNAGQPIGRLLISRMEDEIRLVDIALLAEVRGQGIGAKLIAGLFDRARNENLPVRLHVEKLNPALRLYQRLGFQILEDTGTQYFMEWHS
ncbi:MAG: GNAT family N-acetyltransferase [Blastocatellia bacterium]